MSNTTERETSDLRELQRISNTRVEELRAYLPDFVSVTIITGGDQKNACYAQKPYGGAAIHLDWATYGEAVMVHPDCDGAADEDGAWWGHLRL